MLVFAVNIHLNNEMRKNPKNPKTEKKPPKKTRKNPKNPKMEFNVCKTGTKGPEPLKTRDSCNEPIRNQICRSL